MSSTSTMPSFEELSNKYRIRYSDTFSATFPLETGESCFKGPFHLHDFDYSDLKFFIKPSDPNFQNYGYWDTIWFYLTVVKTSNYDLPIRFSLSFFGTDGELYFTKESFEIFSGHRQDSQASCFLRGDTLDREEDYLLHNDNLIVQCKVEVLEEIENHPKLAAALRTNAETTKKLALTEGVVAKCNAELRESKQILADVKSQLAVSKRLQGEAEDKLAVSQKTLTETKGKLAKSEENVTEMKAKLDLSSKKLAESNKALSQYGSLLETGFQSDVIILAGGTEFRAHKLILSLRSPVFASLFRNKDTTHLEIADMDATVCQEFLRYLYTGNLEKLEKMAMELFKAAESYLLNSLKSICEQYLFGTINIDTACHILLFANRHQCGLLELSCSNYIRSNFNKVKATEGWNKLVTSRTDIAIDLGLNFN